MFVLQCDSLLEDFKLVVAQLHNKLPMTAVTGDLHYFSRQDTRGSLCKKKPKPTALNWYTPQHQSCIPNVIMKISSPCQTYQAITAAPTKRTNTTHDLSPKLRVIGDVRARQAGSYFLVNTNFYSGDGCYQKRGFNTYLYALKCYQGHNME